MQKPVLSLYSLESEKYQFPFIINIFYQINSSNVLNVRIWLSVIFFIFFIIFTIEFIIPLNLKLIDPQILYTWIHKIHKEK